MLERLARGFKLSTAEDFFSNLQFFLIIYFYIKKSGNLYRGVRGGFRGRGGPRDYGENRIVNLGGDSSVPFSGGVYEGLLNEGNEGDMGEKAMEVVAGKPAAATKAIGRAEVVDSGGPADLSEGTTGDPTGELVVPLEGTASFPMSTPKPSTRGPIGTRVPLPRGGATGQPVALSGKEPGCQGSQTPIGSKRPREPSSTGSSEPERKRAPSGEPKRLFKDVVEGGCNLSVAPRDDSARPLTASQFHEIRTLLESLVFGLGDDLSQFKVSSFELVRGRGEIHCSNQFTVNWVKAQFGKTGSSLNVYKAYTGGELTPVVYRRLFSWYPRRVCPPREEMLSLLKRQNSNPKLDFGSWILHSAVPGKGGFSLILSVPSGAFEELKSRNMTLFHGLGVLSFREDSKDVNRGN